jgi:hypothetical protein
MINASVIWILLVVYGQSSATVSPNIQQLYATEKRADCEAQKVRWDAVLSADGVKLRCVEHQQKLFVEQRG